IGQASRFDQSRWLYRPQGLTRPPPAEEARKVLMNVTDFPMLLVEDDPGEIVRVQEALAKANLVNPLRIVNDGLKAIAYLSGQGEYADRESNPFPSLVLLHLTLSEPPGMQVLAWIRSQEHLQ